MILHVKLAYAELFCEPFLNIMKLNHIILDRYRIVNHQEMTNISRKGLLSIWGKHFPLFLAFLTPLILCYHIAPFRTFQELLDLVKSEVSLNLVQRFNFYGKNLFFNCSEICPKMTKSCPFHLFPKLLYGK